MRLVSELRRRNVLRMAVLYVVAAWLIMQVAGVLIDLGSLPDWIGPIILPLLALGFPIALIFSWFYELTPDGIILEKDVDSTDSITHVTGRRLDFLVISLLCAAVILFAYDKWWIGPPPEKSIAVLAFENMSGDPEQEYFSDGLSDTLIHALAQVSDLKVTAKTSSFYFKGKNIDVGEIARRLKVGTILEGSVQKADNRVRVIAQLIDADDGTHRWSKSFDRDLQDIFAIQDEIAQEVVKALKVSLSLAEQNRLETVPTENIAALEAYLLGRQRMAKRTSGALAEAVGYFQHATELDPNFALAYVGLADSHMLLSAYGSLPQEEAISKAEVAIDKALELDDQLGEAHVSIGYLKDTKNDFQGAELAYKRGLELSPNYATAHQWYGGWFQSLGRWEEALAEFRKAQMLDPLSAIVNENVGFSLEQLGRFDEALLQYQKIIEIDPTYPGATRKLGLMNYLSLGKLDQAVVWFRKFVALDPGNPTIPAYLGAVYLDLGDDREAEYWTKRSLQLAPDGLRPNVWMAHLYMYRDEADQALHYSNKALSIKPTSGLVEDVLAYVRNQGLQAGVYAKARVRYEQNFPTLLNDDEPIIDASNSSYVATHLALLLIKTGEQERANLLLDRSLKNLQGRRRLGGYGIGFIGVPIYALQGEPKTALTVLRQAIDEGVRKEWWVVAQHDPALDSIRDEPEFQAMMDEVRADMAAQLERVRAMEASGELEPIPDIN